MKKLNEMKLFMIFAMLASMLVVAMPVQADEVETSPPPEAEVPQ